LLLVDGFVKLLREKIGTMNIDEKVAQVSEAAAHSEMSSHRSSKVAMMGLDAAGARGLLTVSQVPAPRGGATTPAFFFSFRPLNHRKRQCRRTRTWMSLR
jgi:hypothetical protein